MKRIRLSLVVLLLVAGIGGLTAWRMEVAREQSICQELQSARTGGRALSEEADKEIAKERLKESERREGGSLNGEQEACGFIEEAALAEPLDAALARQLYGSDTTPGVQMRKARAQAREVTRLTERKAKELVDESWTFAGPRDIGGRVLDITVDPELPDTIFVATATGGVWRSDDAAQSFRPAWPNDLTQAIGALAQAPDGTLYAGTGEAGPGGGSITYGGEGVFMSRNRGKSWKNIGLPTSSRIGRIVVDPANSERIWVAAIGNLYKPGGERGLYRTDDAGKTWTRTLTGENDTTGVADLAFDPQDPKIAYATTWQNIREPDRRAYTGVGSGVFKSTDGGQTWRRIGTPTFGPSPAQGRLGVTVGAKDHRLWVISTGESGLYQGLFVSADGGTTFTPKPGAVHAALNGMFVYGWWFGRVWVDPDNMQKIYVAGVDMSRSSDGGQTWSSDTRNHSDHHALVWDPRNTDRVYNGSDGGVYVSEDRMASWEEQSKDQTWTQLYGFDVSAQDARRKVVALQDNGDNRSFDNAGEETDWRSYHGGDGTRAIINPENDKIFYGCSQYGACSVYNNGRETSFENSVVGSRKNYSSPLEFEPGKASTVYTGSEVLSRSTDNGVNWTVISPDLSNGPGRETNPLFKNFGTITTISASKGGTTIYAATDDGNLWANHASGSLTGWKKAVDTDLPKAWITRVEADPANPMTAYATYSGFRSGEKAAYVFKTTDGGVTWAPIQSNLPQGPVNDINVHGDMLIVGTDVGVFVSRDGGAEWLRYGRDLPLAPVYELKLAADGGLYAGTFGRGMLRISQP